jgi:hypothetical protein
MKRILASALVLSLFSMGFVGCGGDKKAEKKAAAPAAAPADAAKDKK